MLHEMQEMVIYGVSFDMVGKQPIVLLKTVDSNKFLPIWIGHPEAAAILMKLQGATTPRPMTHDLLCDMLGELDVRCTQVAVTELRDKTFFASITLASRQGDGNDSRRARGLRWPCAGPDLRRGRSCRAAIECEAEARTPRRSSEVQGLLDRSPPRTSPATRVGATGGEPPIRTCPRSEGQPSDTFTGRAARLRSPGRPQRRTRAEGGVIEVRKL